MNNFKLLLYNGSQFVDISDIVQTNINLQDKLDLTLDFASFVIPHAKASYNDIPGIDFSKPIKPWTPLILDINNGADVYRFYTTNSTSNIIGKGTVKRYKHDVQVIEASKSLWGKPIPDMKITQPKSSVYTGIYSSTNRTHVENYPEEYTTVNNTLNELVFTNVNNSSDITKLDGLTIKDTTQEYKISYTIYVYNEIANYNDNYVVLTDAETEFEINVYSGNNLIDTYTKNIPSATYKSFPNTNIPYRIAIPRVVYRTPEATEEISIGVRTIGTYTISSGGHTATPQDTVKVNCWLSISLPENEDIYYRYLDDEVDRVLNSVNLTYNTNYYLSNDARSKISNVLSPEFVFQSYTAWDALEKLANYVNAIPEVGLNNYSEVTFTFLDEEPDLEYDASSFTDETQGLIFDDYNAGLEINAGNLIEEDALKNVKIEPYIGGWMTPRIGSTEIAQFTEANASFKTRQNIYRIYKMFIKGPQIRLVKSGFDDIILSGNAGGTTYDTNTYWDISDLVVEKQRWDTFENGTKNENDSQRIEDDTKGNHIYYNIGTKYIKGLNYKTDVLSDFIGTPVAPRALLETVMKAAALYISETTELDGFQLVIADESNPEIAIETDHTLFRNIQAQIHYIPMANARSTIYRYDAYTRGVDAVKYINEQDRLNDTVNLGEYSRKTVNKLGNVLYTVSGRSKDYNLIPKVNFKTDDGKYILSRNLNLNKNLITYELELSENFLNQSSFVGVNSAYRQYEVSADDFVHRQDKYTEFILLTMDKESLLPTDSNLTYYGRRAVVNAFQPIAHIAKNEYPITYGQITIAKNEIPVETNNTESFDIPVNGYSVGNTINLQIEADDNYSMGPRLEEAKIYSNNIWTNRDDYKLQNFTRYVSEYGRFYSFDLNLRPRGTLNNTIADADEYPYTVSDTYESEDAIFFSLNRINVDKDAGEKYGLNIQFPVLSADSSAIRVYPGFAKYSGLIRDRLNMDLKIGLLFDGYFPGVNDYKINKDYVKILESTEFSASFTYDSSNYVYGLKYENVDIAANTKVQGFVVFEGTTEELIMAVNHSVDRTALPAVEYDFPTIWVIHKKSLNTYMYPDTPNFYTVTFNEMGGTDVQNQIVVENSKATAPAITKLGYTLGGWYTSPTLLDEYEFDFDTLITTNITLYAKWDAVPIADHQWIRVYNTNYDSRVWPEVYTYECPIDYISLLEDPDIYEENHIVEITPYRYCDSSTETCYQNPITMADFQVCETRYYKVVPE